jgi:hypothetical protein
VASTEHTLVSTDTTAGVYQVFLDLDDLAATETLIVRIKEKVQNSSGTQRVAWQQSDILGPMGAEKIWVSPALMLLNGWAVSIESNNTPVIPWSVRKG